MGAKPPQVPIAEDESQRVRSSAATAHRDTVFVSQSCCCTDHNHAGMTSITPASVSIRSSVSRLTIVPCFIPVSCMAVVRALTSRSRVRLSRSSSMPSVPAMSRMGGGGRRTNYASRFSDHLQKPEPSVGAGDFMGPVSSKGHRISGRALSACFKQSSKARRRVEIRRASG